MKKLIALLFVATALQTQAQDNTNDFGKFASQQDQLFVKAYEKRDTVEYNKLLNQFIVKYQALTADEQKNYQGNYYGAYYNLACTYALMKVKPQALDALNTAIKLGYYNYSHMQEDTDLDYIRNEDAFKKMVEPTRRIGDYRYILTNAAAYNLNDNRPFPAFTYQDKNNPNLVALRTGFNLDSIAGTGNDVSKIINLLHWIHNLIPHDGQHGNPEVKNAMSMIAVCKKEGRGLNCRGLSTVLNECYLSLGIPSRFVTCLPKDSLGVDQDCHVINMVYAKSLDKWIWIDPTNDAYVMNEKGELLGIDEVRERVINNKPLIVNPDANWNHKASTLKEAYLYNYMAKNMYMFQCPINSEYDTETWKEGKKVPFVTLIPLDYFRQKPDVNDTKFITFYKTNNPTLFWAKPQL